MNIIRPVVLASSLILALGFSSAASAETIVCPADSEIKDRETTIYDVATACAYALGNPKAQDISNAFGGLTFTSEGEIAGSDGSSGQSENDLLKVNVTTGSWGSAPAGGDFSILASFWDLYDTAVLSFHVGNGGGDPDWMAFSLVEGTTSGDWLYELLNGTTGGGLSNIKLWGATGTSTTPPTSVTEPSQLGVLMLGVIGLIAARRRQR